MLISLDPAIAAVVALVLLGQGLHASEVAGIALVVAAGTAAVGTPGR